MQKHADSGAALLAAERKVRILEALETDGKVVAAELSNRFSVSEDTIRRDLRELADEGLILRVHGGALPRTPVAEGDAAREQESPKAKLAIARAACGLLRDGQVVAIDGGTTPRKVAEQLPANLRITVVTHSPAVAMVLAGHPRAEVVMIGGTLFKSSLVALGAATLDAYRQLHADVCILGIGSLHPDAGMGVLNQEEAAVKRAMLDGAAEIIAVAGGEKIGTRAPFSIAPVSALTHLVTDNSADPAILTTCRQKGVEVISVQLP